jgi:hypothetical protein
MDCLSKYGTLKLIQQPILLSWYPLVIQVNKHVFELTCCKQTSNCLESLKECFSLSSQEEQLVFEDCYADLPFEIREQLLPQQA